MFSLKLLLLKKTVQLILMDGFNCLKATEPLRGDNLLFTNRPPGLPGTYLINLQRMKYLVDLGATQQF